MGDAPANSKIEILGKKFKVSLDVNISISDQEAIKKFGCSNGWNENAQNKFGESATYDTYVSKINQFTDPKNFKIPIYSFYLTHDNKPNLELEQFFRKLRINNEPEDNELLMDFSKKTNFVTALCKYTMIMVAKKNLSFGNADGLKKAAMNLTYKL